MAPAALYMIDRITPTGLYYIAVDAWGKKFTDALGHMFEGYVGAHLRLLPDATVKPEVVFGPPEQRSCDFILIFKEVVVVVEVKASRPTIAVRVGQDDDDNKELLGKLGYARKQIVTTARHIRERHPAFTDIPSDRPLVGLIVTLEPYHLQQTFHAKSIIHSDDVPITLACAHDLEGTVASLRGAKDAGARLLTELSGEDPDRRNLRNASQDLPAARNPILEDSYNRWWPWTTARS